MCFSAGGTLLRFEAAKSKVKSQKSELEVRSQPACMQGSPVEVSERYSTEKEQPHPPQNR